MIDLSVPLFLMLEKHPLPFFAQLLCCTGRFEMFGAWVSYLIPSVVSVVAWGGQSGAIGFNFVHGQ